MASLFKGGSKLPFPLSKPSWPNGVEPAPSHEGLGAHFRTDWSRRYGVRLIRAILLDNLVRPAAKLAASPTVYGEDRLEGLDGPVIFAANHASHLDTPLILSLLPEHFRHRCVVAAGADYFFDKRWKAYIWSGLLAAIPIERNRVSRRSARNAEALLHERWSVLIFPEGGRSPDGLGQAYKGGVAYLAQRTGVPVVPIFIEGTFEMLGKGSSRFKRGTTTLTFGRPLRDNGEDVRVFNRRIEKSVDALALETHTDWWTAALQAGSDTVPSLQPENRDSWIADWRRTATLPTKKQTPSWPNRFGSSRGRRKPD
jgi:1-acyl-sn-glycerol-3-phosphate acyltransferase